MIGGALFKRCAVQVFQFLGDLSEAEVCEKMVDQTVERFGELDVLVSDVAVDQPTRGQNSAIQIVQAPGNQGNPI